MKKFDSVLEVNRVLMKIKWLAVHLVCGGGRWNSRDDTMCLLSTLFLQCCVDRCREVGCIWATTVYDLLAAEEISALLFCYL